MVKADLHIHSSHSDGSNDIKTLLKKIIEADIGIFALTDHDTVEGCKLIKSLAPQNIKVFQGVELTCTSNDINCHILGINCDCNNECLSRLIDKGKILRKRKLEARINYLKDVHNITFTKEELDWLYSRSSVVKTHLAQILVKNGFATDNISAMKKYLDGCVTKNTRFTIEEAIYAINDSNGIPIWAHPLGGEGETHLTHKEFLPILDKMITYGIKGLECYYSRYSEAEENFLVDCAKNNNLLISGGSDYHGSNKDIPLGKLHSENKAIDSSQLTILNLL